MIKEKEIAKIWKRYEQWLIKSVYCTCTKTKPCNSCIISKALETSKSRKVLAKAMVEPIRRSLEYQAVGRKFLMIEELPNYPYKPSDESH